MKKRWDRSWTIIRSAAISKKQNKRQNKMGGASKASPVLGLRKGNIGGVGEGDYCFTTCNIWMDKHIDMVLFTDYNSEK